MERRGEQRTGLLDERYRASPGGMNVPFDRTRVRIFFAVWRSASTVASARPGRADGDAPSVKRGWTCDGRRRSSPVRARRRSGSDDCRPSTRSSRRPNPSTPGGSPTATDQRRTLVRVAEQLQLPAEFLTGCVAPASTTLQARAEIVRLQAQGYGLAQIARSLNTRQVSTPSGRGQWWPDTVRRHVDPGPWAAYIRRYRQTRR